MKRVYACLAGLILCQLNLYSQKTFPLNGTSDPRHTSFVFINARIVTDSQNTIDSSVMIVRNGIIQSVGKNLNYGKDAVVIDLKGKSIYPSLIDIFSDYGMPEIKKPSREDRSPQFLSSIKGAYGWNQAVRSEFEGHLNFQSDTKSAEELRKLGFGAVLSVHKDGIFRGTSPFVLLGNEKENELVLRDRAAANLSFSKGSSTQDYPGSLMGSIALIRQTLYDARWYSQGGYLQEYNISLDAITKQSTLPHIFDAGDKQDQLRADKIAEEFGLQFILKGIGNEYERLEELKNTRSQLIVPLNFPDAIDLTDPYDALNVSLHDLKHWELAPSNTAMLQKAGIQFSITASDLKSKNDFWKNLRKAVENGLSESEALRALTTTPAQQLKLDHLIGSLKPGMMANFIITSGNLFSKETVIYENWVRGIRYRIHDPEQDDIRGNYTLSMQGSGTYRMKISGEHHAPEFQIYQDTTSIKMNGSRIGKIWNFSFVLKAKENAGLYRLNGTVSGTKPPLLSGEVLLPTGSWTGWTARFDSAIASTAMADTGRKPVSKPGEVLYPNMAFGWTKLPAVETSMIKNATVWTNESMGIVQHTDVLIADGKIKSIGKNLPVPAGAKVIDGTGKHLTSGIIDEHSHIAVSSSVNEPTQSSSAEVRIGDVVDADDINIYRQLAGGVTTSHLLHGSANAIGGQTQLIKMRWGKSAEELKFENWPGFIKFALGENVKQSHWGDKQVIRFPQTRMGVEQVYADHFTRAKEYAKRRSLQQKKADQQLLRRDLELDALAEILEGKRHITCHSYEQSEINMLMHVADSFGFKVNTFTHILEGYKVADKMKAHGVTGASSFSDWWGYKFEVYEAIPYNGAILHKMGLTVAYNSDDAEMARRLNQEAAKAVMYGDVSEEEAWKFVTLNPAKMLRIDDRTGSIREGKDADLVLWNENPLSILARPLQTWVDGISYYESERDLQMREWAVKEKARITAKMNEAKSKGEPVQKPTLKPMILKHCNDEEHH